MPAASVAISSGPSTSSTRLFHALHAGQRPAHFGWPAPHSVQRWTRRSLAMPATYGRGVTEIARRRLGSVEAMLGAAGPGPAVMAHRGGRRPRPGELDRGLRRGRRGGCRRGGGRCPGARRRHARPRPRRGRSSAGSGCGGPACRDLDRARYERLTGRVAATVDDLLERLVPLGMGLYLEIKVASPAGVRHAVDAVAGSPLAERAVVGSFDRSVVRQVGDDGRIPASILYRDHDLDPIALRPRAALLVRAPVLRQPAVDGAARWPADGWPLRTMPDWPWSVGTRTTRRCWRRWLPRASTRCAPTTRRVRQ